MHPDYKANLNLYRNWLLQFAVYNKFIYKLGFAIGL